MDINSLKDSTAVKVIGLTVITALVLFFVVKVLTYLNNKRAEEPTWFGLANFFGVYKDTTKGFEVPSKKLMFSDYGKEYTYCFWIKVENWNYLYGKTKHVFHKGRADMSVMNPGVFLHPTKNQLIIRVDSKETSNSYYVKNDSRFIGKSELASVDEANEFDCRKECNTRDNCDSFTLDKIANQCKFYSGDGSETPENWNARKDPEVANSQSYLKVRSMNPDGYSKFELDSINPCDIVDIPLQRWVHIGVVLWNRSLDVYLNGKLSRSCALKGIPNINDGNLYVTQNGGYKGDMATLRYFNRALNPSEVYDIYKQGQDRVTLAKKLLPNIKISFTAEAGTEDDA
jgi:hypothetical protein